MELIDSIGGGTALIRTRSELVAMGMRSRDITRAVEDGSIMIEAIVCQEPRLAVASLDSALHRGFIHHHQLDLIFFHLPQRLQYLRGLIEPRCESGLESVFRLLLIDLGIDFEVQVRVEGVGRVDFILGGRIVVETDGGGFHGEPTRERDYDRDLALAARGYLVLRINYRQVFYSPDAVIEAIRAAMRSHPAAVRPTSGS